MLTQKIKWNKKTRWGRACAKLDEVGFMELVPYGVILLTIAVLLLMEVLQMPVDRSTTETGFADDAPQWLRPYLAAALRSGIITGYPEGDGLHFRPDQPIRTQEAALMVSRAVSFAIPTASLPEQTLEDLGGILTRSDAAKALYRISRVRRESGLMGLFG